MTGLPGDVFKSDLVPNWEVRLSVTLNVAKLGYCFSSLDFHVGMWSGYSITILSFLIRVAFPNIGAQTSPLGSAGLPLRDIGLGQPSLSRGFSGWEGLET